MSFSDLGLSEKVLEAVTAAGYTSPTPIQAQAIPHALARRDVLGIAQTGTGKTAAFTLPMLNLLETGRARARMPRTLILEPTRELAAQVEESFVKLGANHKLSVALLIGGVSFADQDAKITRGADVLIATPGRLLDHFERGKLLLTGIEILVIDEADRMLDMGFIPDIERICKMVPFTRQTLFFSATMPPEIQRLTEAFLSNPVKIEVARPASTANTITQRLVASGSEAHDKRAVLRKLIRGATDLQNAIIFCNRKRDVAILYRSLEKHGFSVVALHGDMDQMSRMQALDSFRNGGASLLVASDVAARGLDIPEVSHVYNYDVPFHAEDYVHRIGRTGRAGRSGYAASIVTSHDAKALAAIEELTGQPITWEGPTITELLAERPDLDQPDPRRGRGRGSSRREGSDARERRASHPARPARTEAPSQPAARENTVRESTAREPVAKSQSSRSHPPRAREALPPVRPGERRDHARYRRNDDELPVVGFGDHIPAFLLRPVTLSALTSDNDFDAQSEIEEVEDVAVEEEAPRGGRDRRERRVKSIAIRTPQDDAGPSDADVSDQKASASEASQPEAPIAEMPAPTITAEEAPETASEVAADKPAAKPRRKSTARSAARSTASRTDAADAGDAADAPKAASKPRRARKAPDEADSVVPAEADTPVDEKPKRTRRASPKKATAEAARESGDTPAAAETDDGAEPAPAKSTRAKATPARRAPRKASAEGTEPAKPARRTRKKADEAAAPADGADKPEA